MGVISRGMMPVCDSLCFFCPSLRTRSRQPVKRYKKLLADSFPKSQDEEPNDRKISKLCEYAMKNPPRIPKIADYLEERCYKELRSGRFGYAKVVLSIYRRLLISCKGQMPLFASSLLNVIHTILDQTHQEEIQILACHTLSDFVANQVDSTYMFNIGILVPKLCLLAQEMGDNERSLLLRSAGLQCLSSIIWFMGNHSHICAEFDDVVSAVLENYGSPKSKSELNQDDQCSKNRWVQEVLKVEGHAFPLSDAVMRAPSWNRIINDKGEVNATMEEAKDPKVWCRACLHNMARLAKEEITARRVLESLFYYFDTGNLWSPHDGLALSVLLDMQFLMENSGQNTHLLLSLLVKHLDHKNVLKQPIMQVNIVDVTICLAQNVKAQPSVPIISAVSDLMRYLRKTMHSSVEPENLGDDIDKWNKQFQSAIEECLVQLSDKVGDARPLLDMMAVMMESISATALVARTTISAVYCTAQIVAATPSLSLHNKDFPEALFHQLLLAMVHPDHETRVGAHRIFSVVLVPSSVHPRPCAVSSDVPDLQRTFSRTVSVFSSSAALFNKLRREKSSLREGIHIEGHAMDGQRRCESDAKSFSWQSSQRALSMKSSPGICAMGRKSMSDYKELDFISLRLSSHQIMLLFSSIWSQATSPLNTPENFEAIAHTYSLALLFSRAKTTNYEALTRSFQLAFSLRSISLGEDSLQPCRRRALFTLATTMIVFLARAYNVLSLIPCIKACLTEATVDPFLRLVEDGRLQAVNTSIDYGIPSYGSEEDNVCALKSLSAIAISDDQTKESMASVIVKSLGKLSDVETSSIMGQMLDEFSHDDVCPLGVRLFMETPRRRSPFGSEDYHCLDEIVPSDVSVDDDTLGEPVEIQKESTVDPSLQAPPLLSVNQLLESVLETAWQVGRFSVSTMPDVPFTEMARKCEAEKLGKQRKLSTFIDSDQIVEPPLFSSLNGFEEPSLSYWQVDQVLQKSRNPFIEEYYTENKIKSNGDVAPAPLLRLPASSPYDNFLKAAGC